MERDIRKEIEETLLEIEKRENVRILHAVESGSRAWGLASPDSDYDVRFVYVRPAEEYLRLDGPRDVIEWQLDEVLDVNGWDLKKALIQFQRGNATLFEWANSPVVYRTTEGWKEVFQAAEPYFSMKTAVYHYYGTAKNTYLQELQEEQVRYKKYFYALRPLLAVRYMETWRRPAPVPFDELLKQELPPALKEAIGEVLAVKLVSAEQERHPQNPILQEFIEGELERQKTLAETLPDDRKRDWSGLNGAFLKAVGWKKGGKG
ncbi:nucleotidyltransferase domain-containing protein [Lachnoclostridium sp. An14]|uniref:nucleotidyltransferase domain-containing protein n=1 Tax=Lachnoclostridium sp. An14 TaxID=1965562 RepID=UPI001FA8970E|nr:nucleotidyltransferase domain-containing protein [Lachnoclostridium sp. An14]